MKLIYYFMLFIYCCFLLFPIHTYDPIVEYQKYQCYYSWLTFGIYNISAHVSKQYDIPLDDIFAIIQSESQGNQYAMSYVGARGLMQVMPCHYAGNSNDLFDIYLNLNLGTKFYKWCLGYTKGNKQEALRVYNSGPFSSRVLYNNWGYVRTILNNSYVSARLENKFYLEF